MIVPVGTIVGLSAVLFGIGVFGFLARRNIILMLISVEVMLNAVNLSLAGFSRHLEDPRGQVLALFVIAVAAASTAMPSSSSRVRSGRMPRPVAAVSPSTSTFARDAQSSPAGIRRITQGHN